MGHALEASLYRDLVPQNASQPDESKVEERDSDHEAGSRDHFGEIGSDERIKPGIVRHRYTSFSSRDG
jgi:hypothetical protein